MRTIAVVLFAAMTLSGCGGTVVGSVPLGEAAIPGTTTSVIPHTTRSEGFTLPTYGLPIAYYSLTVKREERGTDCNLTVSLGDKPIYVRDKTKNYSLNYHHEWYTTDSLSVQTDGQGLLMAINGQSENSTLAAISQTFALAADLMKTVAFFSAPIEIKRHKPVKECKPFSSMFIFDPLAPSPTEKLKGSQVHIEPAKPIDAINAPPTLDMRCNPEAHPNDEKPCIYFRIAQMYTMTVVDEYDDSTRDFIFAAPDTKKLYAIPMVRKDFVKFNDKLTFDHGVLTKYETDNPSELLGFIQIPSTIVKGVLGLEPSKK